ncbi:MAG: hypothetical protein EZS28_035609 [Streblomastix strix]|uniref:Uncharacterized protein n=1 Tax=Streblomastix strix TaxID=222440 RepID=A0A5J4UFD4_9EUKA|nr:MAG: hypothetical protein EZS28_035609 [Streblomastix strix]
MGKVYQYRAMPIGTQQSPIFFAQALVNGLNEDTERIRHKNTELRRQSASLHQDKDRLKTQMQFL